MDLVSESCALESVEENELTNHTLDCSASNVDHDKDAVKTNGSCLNEIHNMSTSRIGDTNALPRDGQVREDDGIEQVENFVSSKPSSAKSPAVDSPPLTKGYGLRKWRRIKRAVLKDASGSADSSKVLKRVLSTSGNPTKPTNLISSEINQNSEGSSGSVNLLRNMGVTDGLPIRESILDSRFAVGSAFALATDSEKSEDRSSKSSTAASAPKLKYDLPAVLGYMREKNRLKTLSGRNVGTSTQRVQQGKGKVESSKKPRGERVKIEKENSHSSMESDSRSSNFVFVQGVCSVTSNGNQSERSMNFDGENSDDAHASEQQLSEDAQTGYGRENVGEADVSQDDLAADASWEDKEEKNENHQSSTDQNPFVESLVALQLVQESLENEVQKLVEIRNASSVSADCSVDQGIHELSSSNQFDSENVRQSSSLESQVLRLTENVKDLESKLEEARALLKVEESRCVELERTLISGKSPSEESEKMIELLHEKSKEIETEIEGLFKQKIEAEVEYLTLTRTMQKLRVAAGDQITLFEQQESLASEQSQMLSKLGEAEKKATILKQQVEGVEKYRGDILETEEVLKMQTRVCKVISCFSIQLVLLILVFWFLVLQLSPRSGVVVPT